MERRIRVMEGDLIGTGHDRQTHNIQNIWTDKQTRKQMKTESQVTFMGYDAFLGLIKLIKTVIKP